MALLKRQTNTLEIFDDQGPTMWGTFVGNWTRYNIDGFVNNTVTATPTIGASLSFTFSGSQAWLYGALSNASISGGNITSYPTAKYQIDDSTVDPQEPWFDSTGAIVYFFTPKLADGTHEIDITVNSANATEPFAIDYFLVTPNGSGSGSGVSTSRSIPSPTSTQSALPIITTTSAPVGAIVGGVVGGIAGIAILILALWYFLRKRSSGGRAYYFANPSPADMLAGEGHVEPSDPTPSTPPVRQSVVTPLTSRYSQSALSETTGVTQVSGSASQPRTGKAALIAQQHQDAQQPVQYEDSGVRFSQNMEQESGPSQLPTEVPPTYTPN